MSMSTPARYDAVAMTLHWLTAILMIFMVFFGEELMEGGEHDEVAVASTFLPSVHVSIGLSVLALTVLRVVWRATHVAPPLPAGMAPWEVTVTKAVHVLFYLLMIGLPVTGWLAFPYFAAEEQGMAATTVFGLLAIPAAPMIGEFAKDVHDLANNVAMALIILHVLAALKHHFVNRDGLLARMVPH